MTVKFAEPARQARYDELVANGVDPRFAEALASWQRLPGSPPLTSLAAAGTEQSFFSATSDPLEGVHPLQREYVLSKLKENGVTDLSGKRYMSQLANGVGDPEAVVGSTTDMRRVLEKRGWGCDGLVKTQAAVRDTPLTHESGPYRAAPQLVANSLANMEADNPALAAEHAAHPEKRLEAFHALSDEMSGLTGRKKRKPDGVAAAPLAEQSV